MSAAIAPGFQQPALQSQQVFRAAMEAMARPGRLQTLTEDLPEVAGLNRATTALLLTLADFDTPVWLDEASAAAADFLRFHCGCPIVEDSQKASFAVFSGWPGADSWERFALGSDAYPDQSATLMIQLDTIAANGLVSMTGPGIEHVHRVSLAGITADWAAHWNAQSALFPRGLDAYLTSQSTICGLPRTSHLEV